MSLIVTLMPLIIAGMLLPMIYLLTLPWVVRHTDFPILARAHLRRFAPLYLIAGPSAVSYFAVCGTLSVVGSLCWIWCLHDISREHIIQSGIFTMLHGVEWGCSLFGAYGFAWLIRWLGLPRLWFGMLFLSLAVTASYRTARLDPGPGFTTGPTILFAPELLDILPVVVGLGLFAFHISRLTAYDANEVA